MFFFLTWCSCSHTKYDQTLPKILSDFSKGAGHVALARTPGGDLEYVAGGGSVSEGDDLGGVTWWQR
jgi:hypothetical protein